MGPWSPQEVPTEEALMSISVAEHIWPTTPPEWDGIRCDYCSRCLTDEEAHDTGRWTVCESCLERYFEGEAADE